MTGQTVLSPSATFPAAIAMLEQCRGFIEAIDDETYTKPCPLMHGSTIGQHVRHSLDHFSAALNALESEAIDYDHRERETDVERDRAVAVGTVEVLCNLINSAPASQADRPVSIRVMLTGEGDETELASTFARELAFASHHAIHHHAIIGSMAREFGFDAPEGFGMAPSTIQYARSKSVHN